jgi:hypothetical protein
MSAIVKSSALISECYSSKLYHHNNDILTAFYDIYDWSYLIYFLILPGLIASLSPSAIVGSGL